MMRVLRSVWYKLVGNLKLVFGDHTRYGVIGNRGRTEAFDFVTESHAHTWAIERGIGPYVVFNYNTNERQLPSVQRARWR